MDSLFTLLRLGLETERISENSVPALNKLTKEDMIAVRCMADRQGVSAIVFDGLSKLVNAYGRENLFPSIDPVWWQTFVYDWIGLAHHIESKNLQQQKVMNELSEKWAKAGCKVMVMKGQANGIYYPQPNYRSPGDIDCYLFEHYALGNDIARQVGAKVDESWYKHSVISYKNETFENHQFFVHTREGKRSKQLEKELEEALSVQDSCFKFHGFVLFPPVQWNAMFLTYHACGHFMSEGLRLKQLLDWGMFIQKEQDKVDWNAFNDFCERHHLRRFAEAASTICVNHLGIKVKNENQNKIVTESPYAERILYSSLYDDDYVFDSGKSGWHNRWHLIRNLFHYRWKYEEIYQQSIYKQLWYYASGYLFKTE